MQSGSDQQGEVPPGALYAERWNGRWTMPGSAPTINHAETPRSKCTTFPVHRSDRCDQSDATVTPAVPCRRIDSAGTMGGVCRVAYSLSTEMSEMGTTHCQPLVSSSTGSMTVSASGSGLVASTTWLPWHEDEPTDLLELPSAVGFKPHEQKRCMPLQSERRRPDRCHPYSGKGHTSHKHEKGLRYSNQALFQA